MLIDEAQFVERSQFFNGQRLFASDLQELEAFNREMRWLHNQSLHQPGIGSGYIPKGKKADRVVTIGPGYALDAVGREIVLTHSWTEPVPPVADDGTGQPVFYDLTVSYPSDSDLKPSETRVGICFPPGVVRLREEPNFCWVRMTLAEAGQIQPEDARLAQQIHDGFRIVLARAEVFNCQLNRDLSVVQRRNARPSIQPHLSCGRSTPEEWRVWKVNGHFVGFTADVDTSEGQFQSIPCYQARIEDSHAVATAKDELLSFIRGYLVVEIREPAVRQFLLRALFPPLLAKVGNPSPPPGNVEAPLADLMEPFGNLGAAASAGLDPDALVVVQKNWRVVWLGVEG